VPGSGSGSGSEAPRFPLCGAIRWRRSHKNVAPRGFSSSSISSSSFAPDSPRHLCLRSASSWLPLGLELLPGEESAAEEVDDETGAGRGGGLLEALRGQGLSPSSAEPPAWSCLAPGAGPGGGLLQASKGLSRWHKAALRRRRMARRGGLLHRGGGGAGPPAMAGQAIGGGKRG